MPRVFRDEVVNINKAEPALYYELYEEFESVHIPPPEWIEPALHQTLREAEKRGLNLKRLLHE